MPTKPETPSKPDLPIGSRPDSEPIVDIRDLSVHYGLRGGSLFEDSAPALLPELTTRLAEGPDHAEPEALAAD